MNLSIVFIGAFCTRDLAGVTRWLVSKLSLMFLLMRYAADFSYISR